MAIEWHESAYQTSEKVDLTLEFSECAGPLNRKRRVMRAASAHLCMRTRKQHAGRRAHAPAPCQLTGAQTSSVLRDLKTNCCRNKLHYETKNNVSRSVRYLLLLP